MSEPLPSYYSNFVKPMFYGRGQSDSVWQALHFSTEIALRNKRELVMNGKRLKIPLGGNVVGIKKLTYIIYHVPVSKNARLIESVDFRNTIDITLANHEVLVRSVIQSILKNSCNSEIVLITNQEFSERLADLPITRLIPEVDDSRPMYYRALCYNTLIQDSLLRGTAIFLDSDCFVLNDFSRILNKLNFCIGLTYRYSPAMMPINEGVIIVNTDNSKAKEFFAHYIGTYNYLKDDSKIKSIYKTDLMRWRGGQLSLNAICPNIRNLCFLDSDPYISFLPSEYFNYSSPNIRSISDFRVAMKNRWIVHLKGKSKLNLSTLNHIPT